MNVSNVKFDDSVKTYRPGAEEQEECETKLRGMASPIAEHTNMDSLSRT